MQAIRDYLPLNNFRTSPRLGPWGGLAEQNPWANPFLSPRSWSGPAGIPDPFLSPLPDWGTSPFHPQQHQFPFNDAEPYATLLRNRDVNPSNLWFRGLSSPCFRHDHHIITRDGSPPFSAGGWELDRRQLIEVQFDHFGVASHCQSTWGRNAPWRPNCYRYSVEEAYAKLYAEIYGIMARLGVGGGGGGDSRLQLEGQDYSLGNMNPSWTNGLEYDQPFGSFGPYSDPRFGSWSNPASPFRSYF